MRRNGEDALFLRYGIDPLDLPHYCDGCNTTFSICHALNYNQGGLVTARHNELCDGVVDLAGKAFTPTHMRNDPLIYTGCAMKKPNANPGSPKATPATPPLQYTEQKGGLLICDL